MYNLTNQVLVPNHRKTLPYYHSTSFSYKKFKENYKENPLIHPSSATSSTLKEKNIEWYTNESIGLDRSAERGDSPSGSNANRIIGIGRAFRFRFLDKSNCTKPVNGSKEERKRIRRVFGYWTASDPTIRARFTRRTDNRVR